MDDLISIIIPVYNTKYEIFKRCIDSILKIVRFEYEVIIIDDGSYKKMSIDYKKYVKNNEKIKYIRTKNMGVSSARNLGIKTAKGKYIMFVDSDDEIIYENINNIDLNKGYDLIFFNINKITNHSIKNILEAEGGSREITSTEILNNIAAHGKFYNPFSKLYNLNFIKKHNIFFDSNIINGEDLIFNISILKKHPRCFFYNKSIYNYFFNLDNGRERWNKNFEKMFSNFENKNSLILNNDEILLKNKKIYINKIINELIKVSLILSNENQMFLDNISNYIKTLKCESGSIKIIFGYWILKYKKVYLIKLLSKLRKIWIGYRYHGGR